MDAAYLRSTVNEALIEALSSMATNLPEDKVEYIGKYLLQYVERKSAQTVRSSEAGEAESKYAADESINDIKRATDMAKDNEAKAKLARLAEFQATLPTSATSKQEAMDKVTAFAADYLGVQGAYLSIKRVAGGEGGSEALHYYSASPGQEFVVGKKLVKAAEADGEETPARQGLSFDAFKIPEVPEDEAAAAAEAEEGQEGGAPPKPAPKAQPLVVENCMRERRLKFFGIPRLGSYAAVPITYASVDHVEGCVLGMTEPPPPDPEKPDEPPVAPTPTYTAAKLPNSLILGLDTVGEYRNFTAAEIDTAVSLGDTLVATFELIEAKMFDAHVAFLEGHRAGAAEVAAAVAAAVAADEAAALETVALQLAPPPVDPDAPPPSEAAEPPAAAPESLKPYSETIAVLRAWSSADNGLGSAPFAAALASLQNHVLPAPAPVVNLLYALGLFLGVPAASLKDVCGDVTWEAIRVVRLFSSLPLFSLSSLSLLLSCLLLLLLLLRLALG